LATRQWLGMAIGPWTHRIDRRSVDRGVIRRNASTATLYVVRTSVRGRRGCLLRDPSAQHPPPPSASGIGSGAGEGTACSIAELPPVVFRAAFLRQNGS